MSNSRNEMLRSSLKSSGVVDLPLFVTELSENDVLMGRGTPSAEYSGNTRLRQLVLERRQEYLQCSRRSEKHQISMEIIETIHKRGGRFLQRITTMEEAERLNVPPKKQAWKVVGPSAALFVKVKQLMRDVGMETQMKRRIRREKKKEASKLSSSGSGKSNPKELETKFPPNQSRVAQRGDRPEHCQDRLQIRQKQSDRSTTSRFINHNEESSMHATNFATPFSFARMVQQPPTVLPNEKFVTNHNRNQQSEAAVYQGSENLHTSTSQQLSGVPRHNESDPTNEAFRLQRTQNLLLQIMNVQHPPQGEPQHRQNCVSLVPSMFPRANTNFSMQQPIVRSMLQAQQNPTSIRTDPLLRSILAAQTQPSTFAGTATPSDRSILEILMQLQHETNRG